MATTPIAPPAPAPVAPVTQAPSAHNPVDVITNKLAAAMSAARGPVQPPLASPSPAVVPPSPVVEPPAAPVTVPDASVAGAAAPVVTPAEAAFDIDNVDFDNPPAEAAPVVSAAPPVEAAPGQVPDGTIETQLGEMLAKGEIPDKIEQVFLKHSRGKQMLTSFKRDRELAKPVAEGGIGRVPTVDEVRAADAALRTNMLIQDEFQNNPESFAYNLLHINPETGRNFFGGVQHIRQVIQNIPKALESAMRASNPQVQEAYTDLYAEYTAPVFNTFLNAQYQDAQSLPQGTPEQVAEKVRFLDALQYVEYRIFGRARALNPAGGPVAPAGSPNMDSFEVQQLRSQLEAANRREQDTNRQRTQSTLTGIESKAEESCRKDIDTLVKTAGLYSVYSPELLNPLKESLFNEVKGVLKQHDPTSYQRYEMQTGQAARGQVDSTVPATTFQQMFRNALRGNVGIRDRIANIVKSAKSSSDAQHQSLAQSQLRVEPNGTGSPAPASVISTAQLAQLPGETRDEFTARKIRAASEGMRVRQ